MSSVTSIDQKQTTVRADAPAPRILAVVAHPDDEYHFAVTLFKVTRELGGIADQVIITDGAGGHRYSRIAEHLYGVPLHSDGLREIRRAETAVSGHVLGIRQHFFLDQPDTGFTLNITDAIQDWDHFSVTERLDHLLDTGNYDFVLLLLPSDDTHGHHKATALLALEAIERLPIHERPVVLAAEAGQEGQLVPVYSQLRGQLSTRASERVFFVARNQPHPEDEALSYQIIANWVITAHKSQGLFQMEAGRHDIERFWVLEAGHPHSIQKTEALFARLEPASARPVSIPA